MGALYALASSVVFGAADFTGGYAARRSPILTVTLISNLAALVIAAVLVAIVGGTVTTATAVWSAAAGMCGLVGIVFLYLGLAEGPARLVSPLSAVIAAIIPVVVGLVGGDQLSPRGLIGMAFALPAIWLVAAGEGGGEVGEEASEEPAAERRAVPLAVIAGLGFGLFFVCMAQTADDAGAAPLLIAKTTSTLTVLAVVWVRRKQFTPPDGLLLPAGAGLLDMTANGLFLSATRQGDLATVSALTNLYPVTTVVLAVIVLHEHLSRVQTLGLILAVTAAVLLS